MDANDDFEGNVLTMNRPSKGIRELLSTPPAPPAASHYIPDQPNAERQQESLAEPTPDDLVDPLPRPGDDYKAHSRKANKPQATLFFVSRDCLPDGFAYADLRRCRLVTPGEPGKGPVLRLQFNETEVRIEGRNLNSLCFLIGMHLMPWIWEMPGRSDRHDDAATVVSKIVVEDEAAAVVQSN